MIQIATAEDYPAIIHLWELSVRATHDFLPEDYLQEIKQLLPEILPQLPVYCWKTVDGVITGFAGVAAEKIEMLFIHPAARGKGIGKQLTGFCIKDLGAWKVDVNEQNKQAIGFYERMGFVQTGFEPLDGMGRAFPLLLMELR
jgi:putative acetyltransferase